MRLPLFYLAAGMVAFVAPAHSMEADRESVFEIQVLLQHLGYEPGRMDGLAGPRLARAIRTFEADHGLPITGQADMALNERLHGLVAARPGHALLEADASQGRGFWQRHSWPARMGGL